MARVNGVGALVAAACVLATAAGAGELLRSGTFDWHLRQPTFVQGGLELMVVWVLLFAASRLRRSAAFAVASAAVVVLFVRLHSVDLALIASGVYCAGIYGLGSFLSRALAPQPASADLAEGRRVLVGLLTLSCVLWSGGLWYGLGFRQTQLLGAALALAGLALGAGRWRSLGHAAADRVRGERNALASAGWTLLATALLGLLVRTNTVLYYDSIWYGLRPDRVLFGEHGIYSYLGLTTQVHYYPKLYEVALSPLQGHGDLSIDLAFNLWATLFLVFVVRACAMAQGISTRTSTLLAVALTCVPACLGAAETSKGDVLAAAFVLLAARFVQEFARTRDSRLLADVLACALVATGLRLSTLPWLAVLLLATVALWVRLVLHRRTAAFAWLRGGAGMLSALAVWTVGLVHYRTFALTGTWLITNAKLQHSLDALGWKLRFPIGSLTGGEAPAGASGLVDVLNFAVAPSGYRFHVIKWMGAVWLVGALVVLARLAIAPSRVAWLRRHGVILAIGLLFPVVICLNAWPVRGGDGNYFIVPAACLAIAGFAAIRTSRLVDAGLLASAVIGTAMYLLTSNWVTGTEVPPRTLLRSPFDARQQLDAYLAQDNLTYVANYLGKCNVHTRVTGLLPDSGPAFALPARYEPLQEMDWDNAASLASTDAFGRLMKATGTQLVVLPADDRLPHVATQRRLFDFVRSAMLSWQASGRAVEQTRRGDYVLYRLTDAAPLRNCPAR
ncbi:hypothetical protein [Cognatilysobacter lacus]|uniref:Glycosyltransferase RgtA/B/C/D-like domain-containing protein n=1 Tax=Cognatilysobacter lacus TaxID=1643323 RepID=A0A5D8Z8S0_9GAMM|nr:hypothetical protein [Lysobacter lacus]TZF91191.1 hypothetical protein FW784_02575 [Lysobacter lacus]